MKDLIEQNQLIAAVIIFIAILICIYFLYEFLCQLICPKHTFGNYYNADKEAEKLRRTCTPINYDESIKRLVCSRRL